MEIITNKIAVDFMETFLSVGLDLANQRKEYIPISCV